jgi:hypothetical protein
MKKTFALSCLMLAGAVCNLKAVDQHHVWNKTGETVEVKFEYNDPGYCSDTRAILHHTTPSPYASLYTFPTYPDWLQKIERSAIVGVPANCPLRKVVVTGLTGSIKGQVGEHVFTKLAIEGERKPVHLTIDRDGNVLSIKPGADPRITYKQNPNSIPELTLKRHDDATEKLAGQKYYYAWNTERLAEQNIKKEMLKLKIQSNETPSEHKLRVKSAVKNARDERTRLEKLANQLSQ